MSIKSLIDEAEESSFSKGKSPYKGLIKSISAEDVIQISRIELTKRIGEAKRLGAKEELEMINNILKKKYNSCEKKNMDVRYAFDIYDMMEHIEKRLRELEEMIRSD